MRLPYSFPSFRRVKGGRVYVHVFDKDNHVARSVKGRLAVVVGEVVTDEDECDWHPEPKVEETGVHPSEDGADDGDGGRLDDQAREESRGELHQQLQSLK